MPIPESKAKHTYADYLTWPEGERIIKFNMYEKAGVKEYWIIEPEGKLVSVFVLQETGRYGRQEAYSEEDQITLNIIPDLAIDLNLVF